VHQRPRRPLERDDADSHPALRRLKLREAPEDGKPGEAEAGEEQGERPPVAVRDRGQVRLKLVVVLQRRLERRYHAGHSFRGRLKLVGWSGSAGMVACSGALRRGQARDDTGRVCGDVFHL
jgi:hypothetical protein